VSHIFKRNQQVSLKTLGVHGNILMLGIGWNNKFKPGLWNRITKKRYDCDLDLSCVLYDGQNERLDTVWYAQLQSKCGGIRHTGDSTIDSTELDEESLTIDLNQIDKNTKNIFFVISSFKGSRFSQIENCYWRLYDPMSHREVGRFNFSDKDKIVSKIVLNLQKMTDENGSSQWVAKALYEEATGKNVQEIMPEIRDLLEAI
jgi:tellurium resistance protein TerZ